MISFFQLVAFISINLGVMNLLPLPALDGGRLVFIIEGIRRKPVPPKQRGLCARGRTHAAAYADGVCDGQGMYCAFLCAVIRELRMENECGA